MVNRKLAKVSTFRYKILATVFIVLAGGLVLLPKHEKHEGIKPELLLANLISTERYISTDILADKIINNDPSFILIDVRNEESYSNFTIGDALNIPLEKFLDEVSINYLDQNQYDIIFISNDNFYAEQAWMLGSRLGFKNLHVLEGGINKWFNTIINPKKPTETMPEEQFVLYSNRKAASMFFGVAYPEQFKPAKKDKAIVKTKQPAPPKKVIKVKKKKKAPAEGGC